MRTLRSIVRVFHIAIFLLMGSILFLRAEPDDGNWTLAAKNFANTRYSGLSEINPSNVSQLKVAWTFETGVNRGQESAPLVVSKLMFIVTPYPNYLYALDLAQSGQMKWKSNPNRMRPFKAKHAAIPLIAVWPITTGRFL